MRKPIIAGNWKMNKTPDEAREMIAALAAKVADAQCEVVLCVPYINLDAAIQAAKGTNIRIGAQNMHFAASGAFTGEVSADMLCAVGATHVIIGHSERRQYYGETDETVNKKTHAALAAGLVPIVCVGESRAEREAGYTDALMAYQTKIALSGLTAEQVRGVVVAYEPVWAIGTGLTATDDQANETIGVIREAIGEAFDAATAEAVRIQYGGSMNPKNAYGLMQKPEIDGGLIGGASLSADDFEKVVHFERKPA